MPAKVTLTVEAGPDKGRVEIFEERESLTIGRNDDCNYQVPITEETTTISRYHCMMEIVPPEVTVRDFGSKNGTFLNGKEIGRRKDGMSAEEGWKLKFNEADMKDGDILNLSKKYSITVSIYTPQYCAECRCELPENEKDCIEVKKDLFLCTKCHKKKKEKPGPILLKKRKCNICDKVMPKDAIPDAEVCDDCMHDPLRLLERLFENAKNDIGDAGKIGEYQKIKRLGQGGMGEVWQVKKEKTDDIYALKLMLPKMAGNEKSKKQFLLEAHNATQLNHPNIVRHYKSGYSDGVYFILMEYCDFGSIDDLMKTQGGRLPLGLAMRLILQTLDGLEYAHNAKVSVTLKDGSVEMVNGLVHRDINPHNILLCGDSENPIAKVADYGLAKAFETAGMTGRTRTGSSAGKPVFMPRQQAINYKYSQPDVDVWAAAASLYYMLTGEFPKKFSLGEDLFRIALTSRAVPILKRPYTSEIPTKLAKIIDKALNDSGDLKFKSALELKQELEKTL